MAFPKELGQLNAPELDGASVGQRMRAQRFERVPVSKQLSDGLFVQSVRRAPVQVHASSSSENPATPAGQIRGRNDKRMPHRA
jgi:hypothetical protein